MAKQSPKTKKTKGRRKRKDWSWLTDVVVAELGADYGCLFLDGGSSVTVDLSKIPLSVRRRYDLT